MMMMMLMMLMMVMMMMMVMMVVVAVKLVVAAVAAHVLASFLLPCNACVPSRQIYKFVGVCICNAC